MKPVRNEIRIEDIFVDRGLINITRVAHATPLSVPYVTQLLDPNNKRKNKRSLRLVRNAIVKLYGPMIKQSERAA